MTRNIIPESTVIQTGNTGVLAICDCKEQRHRDELIAGGASSMFDLDVFPLMYRDGRATNRYEDGVVGVNEDIQEYIEDCEEEPYCPECDSYIRGWIHTTEE